GEPASDPAEPDDQQRLAADLLLAPPDIAHHAAPVPPGLVVARLGEPAGERQDERHGMLGDRAPIDALGAGKPDAAALPQGLRILVGARAGGLDEAEPRRPRQELVAPETRDHHHIGLADPPLELFRGTDPEARDAGTPDEEALLQAIGDMGEADDE